MEAKYLNSFSEALINILKMYDVTNCSKGEMHTDSNLVLDYDCTLSLGLSGEINGNISFCMSEKTVLNVAQAMIGFPMEKFDKDVLSAMSEFVNMVSGRATIKITSRGNRIDITPPVLIRGQNVAILINNVIMNTVKIESECGVIQISLGIEDNVAK